MPTHRHRPRRRRPLSALLKSNLRQARSLAVVGIGSDLRGDDAAGLLVLRYLRAALTRSHVVRLFEGGTAPENLTGEIIRFRPSHILMVDAADMGMQPGTAALIEAKAIGGMSCSTHVLPLSILADYLNGAHPCRILLLGIQPGRIAFGSAPSRNIDRASRRVARLILDAAPRRESR